MKRHVGPVVIALALLGTLVVLALPPEAGPTEAAVPGAGAQDAEEPAPASSYEWHPTHVFGVEPDRRIAFAVPESSLPATVTLWFEGASAGGQSIRVFDPSGVVLLESQMNGGAGVGGRSNVKEWQGVLPAGEYVVEFAGPAGPVGHAHLRTT